MVKNDTIAAIATSKGAAGVAIIRISGDLALAIAKKITKKKTLTPRYAHYAKFYQKAGTTIDQGIAIYFESPHSYTGEDVVELHGHGGCFVSQSLLQLVLSCGARQAKPGEFTERAFLNDKIDLLQAEAVADLISSRTTSAAQAALRSLSGTFSLVVDELQAALTDIRVYVEAALDFSEEDIDFLSEAKIKQKIKQLLDKVKQTQRQANYGKLLHDGHHVVLVGAPNVGKSSLMNRLLGHERAIVTDEAGTTRDTLEETLIIDGIPVKITDTAGLRDTENTIEKAGIARAKTAVKNADLAIWLRDTRTLDDEKPSLLEDIDYIELHNKVDLVTPPQTTDKLAISAKTGQGIEQLMVLIAKKMGDQNSEEGVFSARERHIQALKTSEKHITNAKNLLQFATALDLMAEELRIAQQSLSEITGQYRSDDLLGDIFSSFCVGK